MNPPRVLVYGSVVVLALVGLSDRAIAGVAVGDSTLIGLLDYTDSFTLTADGGNPGRVANAYPVNLPGINVEDNHGNPPQVWTDAMWSISSDAVAIPGATPYPGGSGSGSATGMTQRGGSPADWGIEYGLRDEFVVQTDFVQTADRVDITVGGVRDTISNNSNLSIFFRRTGHPSYPEIGIYNPAVGERNTGLRSGIATDGEWHNYAVRVSVPERILEIYVDEVSRGAIDLDLVAGGAFAGVPLSNAAVGAGYAGNDRGWSDNFQVGSSLATGAPVSGVPVGSSSLIGTLDYSDSFTLTASGGIAGRVANAYPVGLPGIQVEDSHGNPARTWTDAMWSVSSDGAVNPGGTGYAIGSGAGSDTGMTQRGGSPADWGIDYGLRRDFTVQTDFVQTADRIDITAGGARDTIFNNSNLSIFFRRTGHPSYPEIGIYNPAVGEHDTGLTSGIATDNQWHNYAVRFDTVHRQLEVFVDEVSRGTIDLDTVGGGAFASVPLSNAVVGVGYSGNDRGWSDNFQVGDSLGAVVETLPALAADYEETFTINPPTRPEGLYNDNGSGGYNVEQTHGNPAAAWAPISHFSFNSQASWYTPSLLDAATGNPGAFSGVGQSGTSDADFSFAYGLRDDYMVVVDAILPPGDRINISSLPAAGSDIRVADSLSVFFRRDSVTSYPAIGLFNGTTETGVLAPGSLGIDDFNWHNFAVWFDRPEDLLRIYVDRELIAELDLTTFAGGIYQDYSNAAVGTGGTGVDFGTGQLMWFDNFRAGLPVTAVPEPSTLALAAIGAILLGALTWRSRRRGWDS